MNGRITGLGAIRIYDNESGKMMLEGKMQGMTFRDERGNWWTVKRTPEKKCPHCGKPI